MTKGQRIKHSREVLGLSQSEVAERLGEKKQTIYKYENDIVTNIPSDKFEKLARILNVTPAYLMGWDEPEVDVDKEISILIEKTGKSRLATFLDAYSKLPPEDQEDVVDYVIYKSNKDKK